MRPAVVWFLGFPLVANLKKSILLVFPLLVGVAGFEPATLRLSSACSNQLSYTPGLQILRSPQGEGGGPVGGGKGTRTPDL